MKAIINMKKLLPFFFLSLGLISSSYAFTLRDVERKCEVWRWSENWGDVECRGSDLRAIESCSVWMWSDSWGDIDC